MSGKTGSRRIVSITAAVALTLALIALAGCGGAGQAPQVAGGGAAKPGLAGSIQIAGSTSVQPLSEELAKEFQQKNAKVTVNVAGGGSGAGIKAAREGTADFGASSRELKPEEKASLKEYAIAYDAIVVVVHPSSAMTDIKIDDARKVFSGAIKNWKELGGKDAPITVVTREEGSGTRGAFEEIVMGKDKIVATAIVQNSTGAVRTAVAKDSNAIGYISLGSMSSDVKGLQAEGVAATAASVKNKSYRIARPFLYLAKDEPKGAAKAFLDFVLGDEGQKVVAKSFITVK